MDLKLAGHVAVVFGAARGIGRAIAAELAAESCRVALVDREAEVEAAARELAGAIGLVADVTDLASVERAADAVEGRLGPIDHVVYAVGIGSGHFGMPYWNVPPQAWAKVLEVNLIGAAHVGHALGPRLAGRGGGSILLLGSVAGQIGSPTDPPYSASKAGLINFGQCMARDLAPFGVRVNVLNPGMVRTALNRSVWQAWADRQPPEARQSYEDWTAEKIRRLVPLNRWQEPEDIAAMAAFLCSERARNITGQTINVDGGYVMHW